MIASIMQANNVVMALNTQTTLHHLVSTTLVLGLNLLHFVDQHPDIELFKNSVRQSLRARQHSSRI